jgi:transposase
LQKGIVKHRARILAAIEHNLLQRADQIHDTKIRLLTRMAFGFQSAETLIALAMLNLGGHRLALLDRTHPKMSQPGPQR